MEIGSNFWINPYEPLVNKELGTPSQFGCIGQDYVWLSTGRSATRFVIKSILERKPKLNKRVLLPPFTCDTVIAPFLESGFFIDYYEIDNSLKAISEDLVDKAIKSKVSVVLFHRYFGFETISDYDYLIKTLQDYNIIVIEDCTQCLFSEFNKSLADYTIGSIRKWMGVPDGGFATCKSGVFTEKPVYYDKALEEAKVIASHNKYKYLFESIGSKTDFLLQYRIAEDILEKQNDWYRISNVSALVLSNQNIPLLKEKRRSNYQQLSALLANNGRIKPVLNKLHTNEVPLYYPIVVDNREALQKELIKNSIYAPVVWPKMIGLTNICESAEYLYNKMLCIPIDQRYSNQDVERVARAINDYV